MPKRLFSVAIFCSLAALLLACVSKDTVIHPFRKDITQAVYASGKLFPLNYYHATSSIPGYIDTFFVRVGDTVRAGQPLFRVKNESMALVMQAAENEGTHPTGTLDKKTSDKLQIAVKKNSKAYANGKKMQQGVIVYAVESGKVYDISVKLGEFVAPQVPVMDIGDGKNYQVELNIDETDLTFVSQGQEVVYTAEAFPKQFFTGTITAINPKISPANRSIKVTASINLPSGTQIFAGSTLEANIIYKKEKAALVIPKIYVQNDTVLLRNGLNSSKRAVVTGIEDVEYIQIVSGVTESDELVKPK